MHYRADISKWYGKPFSEVMVCASYVVGGAGDVRKRKRKWKCREERGRLYSVTRTDFFFRCNASTLSWSSCGRRKERKKERKEERQNQRLSARRSADPRTKMSLASSSSCSSSSRVSLPCQPRPRHRPRHHRNRAFYFQHQYSVKRGGRSQWRDATSECETEALAWTGAGFRHRKACLLRMPPRNSIRAA